ncbi:MAG: helix-turn-helix domain-containing protein [Roseburia sp.]|nr:helix-turn-helix domain-containing protein [Roseburia sp.]MCM1242534.1 helix-turn-helix domain-containing protein [Roseburia sp.]
MINLEKTGKQIAFLRRERGYTGEGLAERLGVSPQAISKWENAKCLPETAILPELAKALDCSIDDLLCPRELFILEAVYTDGVEHIPVTHFINGMVHHNTLNIYVNEAFVGADIKSGRLKILTVKFQTPQGIFFTHALQNENLFLDKNSTGATGDESFRIVGAYYGNEKVFSDAMQKMEHYEYFKWDKIAVDHETFPSDTASDDTEYLTLIYINTNGIHVISCPENQTLYYGKDHTELWLRDDSGCILKNVMRLSWGAGMECPWAGALYGALQYMGETYTYQQIMGMSGACYRICFTPVWDYSCTDALVAYDYATPLYEAIGYSFQTVERLEKQERKAERLAIMSDIQNGKPVLAINLRVAPEWGIITGYTDNGNRFLCRTYFDKEIFAMLEQEERPAPEDKRLVFEDNEGYLFSDFWPFIILHFGEKKDAPSPLVTLQKSLRIFVDSFHAGRKGGYYQGKEAYNAWIEALSKEEDFELEKDRENVLRRLGVNDSMMCSLIDARSAAAAYLRESSSLSAGPGREHLERIAENCQTIADMFLAFRDKVRQISTCEIAYNGVKAFGVFMPGLRSAQIDLLKKVLMLEEESCRLAEAILEI